MSPKKLTDRALSLLKTKFWNRVQWNKSGAGLFPTMLKHNVWMFISRANERSVLSIIPTGQHSWLALSRISFVVFGVLLTGWEGSDSLLASEKNIVFFVTDDEGKTMGCYGDTMAKTPHVDALARDGVRFDNAFATTASCSASRSVILSGLHNHMNGQYGHQHHFHKFASFEHVSVLSLPRALTASGYRTCHIGKYHVAPEHVYRFETYLKGNPRSPVEMAEQCRAFLSNKEDSRPFFLYFATSDPHRGGGVDRSSSLKHKPNLFGNRPNQKSFPGINEVFYEPEAMKAPAFLPDSPETRAELAQYYQSCARIDQGLGRLIEILKENDLYDRTLIVRTSDHGMAFAGGKTTVYDPGLNVPFVVRNPYEKLRGKICDSLVSHIDITPSLLDFAGALNRDRNRPKSWKKPLIDNHEQVPNRPLDNFNGRHRFNEYHGKSWLSLLSDESAELREEIFASHTFHEIQMYYPMRVIRDKKYKLIWNVAHKLDYPFATDLWAASSWQAQYQQGMSANYGVRTVKEYIHRPEFELYDIATDPNESNNLANQSEYRELLGTYQEKLKTAQQKFHDPWILKWKYE